VGERAELSTVYDADGCNIYDVGAEVERKSMEWKIDQLSRKVSGKSFRLLSKWIEYLVAVDEEQAAV